MRRVGKKIEIMSPVGSYESLMAAIQAGADAVYFGVGNLNMRARSSINFSLEDLQKISEKMKGHSLCWQVTLNSEKSIRSELAQEALKILS